MPICEKCRALIQSVARSMRLRNAAACVLALVGLASAGPQPHDGPTGEAMTTAGGSFRIIGGSGWFEYCPSFSVGGGGDTPSSCFRFRPFAFEELDRAGHAVPQQGQNGRPRRINNLFSSMQVGRPQSAILPPETLCSAFEERACGWTDGGRPATGLPYISVPISVDLSGIGAGASARLNITTYLFTANGTLQYDGQRVSVREGMGKFDVGVSGYAFSAAGVALSFRVELNAPDGSSSSPPITVDPATGASTVDGVMLNFPRFACKPTANAAAWDWRNASVRASGAGLAYEFAGPFEEAQYDPMLGDTADAVAPQTDAPLAGTPAPPPTPPGGPATQGKTSTGRLVGIIVGVVVAAVLLVAVGANVLLRRGSKVNDGAMQREYVQMQ